jgi:hypothetical protein
LVKITTNTFKMNYKTHAPNLDKKETKAATKQILKQIGEFQYLILNN